MKSARSSFNPLFIGEGSAITVAFELRAIDILVHDAVDRFVDDAFHIKRSEVAGVLSKQLDDLIDMCAIVREVCDKRIDEINKE